MIQLAEQRAVRMQLPQLTPCIRLTAYGTDAAATAPSGTTAVVAPALAAATNPVGASAAAAFGAGAFAAGFTAIAGACVTITLACHFQLELKALFSPQKLVTTINGGKQKQGTYKNKVHDPPHHVNLEESCLPIIGFWVEGHHALAMARKTPKYRKSK